jgi:protocatechuate 3,4-dioxygenase beta subunit
MTGTTDENGAFTFNGLAPGNYTVSAGMRRGAHGQAKVTLPEGDNGAAPTASITVNLEAPATQPS